MLLELLWQSCQQQTTLHMKLSLMCDQGVHDEWTHMTNIQVIKTCTTNVQAIETYV